jgi:hypothetical protein
MSSFSLKVEVGGDRRMHCLRRAISVVLWTP